MQMRGDDRKERIHERIQLFEVMRSVMGADGLVKMWEQLRNRMSSSKELNGWENW